MTGLVAENPLFQMRLASSAGSVVQHRERIWWLAGPPMFHLQSMGLWPWRPIASPCTLNTFCSIT